ncbi:ABC transporter substrate-binding protein [Pseudomonas sp. Marseille-QA0892]
MSRQLRHHLGALMVMILASISIAAVQAEPRQVVDVLGRSVTIPSPAKRVVLGFNFEDYMAVGGDSAFDSVVGISKGAWVKKVPAIWALYAAHRPSLEAVADVGEVEAQNFSIEKVMSLQPDLVVLAAWQFQGLGDEIARLEQLGIPVVAIDYNAQTLERHVASTLLLGVVTGQEQRARELADLYTDAVNDVNARIASAGKPRPRIYLEFGNQGPSQYSFTYGKNMWGAMATAAGGDNIAAPYVEWWGPINPEQVLVARPEVVVISGREDNSNPTAMLMGPGVEPSEARKRLAAFANRSGWSQLPAIQDSRLYGVYQNASRTLSDFAMLQFIAKQLYPEQFADIDPVANYLDFYRKYLPVVPEGTFAIGLTD